MTLTYCTLGDILIYHGTFRCYWETYTFLAIDTKYDKQTTVYTYTQAGKAVITKETEAARKKVWSRKAGWATFFISESADEYVDPNAKGKGQAEKAADQGADNNANANANAVGNAANANDNGNAAPVNANENAAPVNANENAAPVNANVNAAPVNANVNAAQANDNGNEEKKQENKEADIKDKDRYIIVDQVGDKGAGYKDLFNHLSDKKCCYILYDHVSTGKLNRKLEKQYFIFWYVLFLFFLFWHLKHVVAFVVDKMCCCERSSCYHSTTHSKK